MEGINETQVTAWFEEHITGASGPLTFELIAGGRSNLTFRVTDADGNRYVLRRPPLGHVLPTAHDMTREHRIISALGATDVPARPTEEAHREIGAPRTDGPTDAELDSARDYLRGILPLTLQTTAQVADRIGELVVFDLPADYFASYRDRIADVSAEDVRRVANEAVRPDRLAIVVVGDADQVRAPIEALGLGPVEVHESSA